LKTDRERRAGFITLNIGGKGVGGVKPGGMTSLAMSQRELEVCLRSGRGLACSWAPTLWGLMGRGGVKGGDVWSARDSPWGNFLMMSCDLGDRWEGAATKRCEGRAHWQGSKQGEERKVGTAGK